MYGSEVTSAILVDLDLESADRVMPQSAEQEVKTSCLSR